MWRNKCLMNFVKSSLPSTANILMINQPYEMPAIIMCDLDGDGVDEIVAAYRWQGENYVIIFKNKYNSWSIVANIKGKGYNVSYLNCAPLTSNRKNNLIIGWQVGGIWSELSIFELTQNSIKEITKEGIYYSKIEVEDMPGYNGKDGIYEVALWVHDTGDAYKVEISRWENEKFNLALDVYEYYFKKVAAYYEKKLKEVPQSGVYWYYLADAQWKSKKLKEALNSVKVAREFENPYPSIEELNKLEKQILSKYENKENDNLYPASIKTVQGVKWGYINDKGNLIIKPQYEMAMSFEDNIAIVQMGNLQGIINKQGKFVVEPKYQSISNFTEERAIVIDKDGFKVIDEKGKEMTSKPYDYIATYREERALFGISDDRGNYLYGYLDRNGKEVIPAKYRSGSDFNDGKAITKVNEGEYALIGLYGGVLNTYKYDFVGNLGEGLLTFQKTSEGKYGYIDEKGNIVIEPQFIVAMAFENGRAIINNFEGYKNYYGVIDKQGKFIIEPKYNYINSIGEARMSVGKAIDSQRPYIGSKYAIFDLNGNKLTEFIYYGVSEYEDGLASAYDNKDTFFIDISGKRIDNLPAVQGSGILTLEDNIIKANVDFRISYLDKNGNIIWKQNKNIPLNSQYNIMEEKFRPNRDYLVYYPAIKGMKDVIAQQRVNKKLKDLSQVKYIPPNVQLDYNYLGDFNIEFFKKDLLVLEIVGYKYYYGAAHGMTTKVYPHINLITGEFYELKDLFKKDSNYEEVLNKIIAYQIKNDPQYSYIFPDGFKGIKPNQPFYVDENALYIYFNPYEIAPYAVGFPTFKIPYKMIMNIIDTNGSFWNSFNNSSQYRGYNNIINYELKHHSIKEIYRDIIMAILSPYISNAIKNYYNQNVDFNLFSIKILEAERIGGYRSLSCNLKIQVYPFEGCNNAIGIDNLTFSIEPSGIIIKDFQHVSDIK